MNNHLKPLASCSTLLYSSASCSWEMCTVTLKAVDSCRSSNKCAIEVVAKINSLRPSVGGCLRSSTMRVCSTALENRMPTGVKSKMRSISSMKITDNDDLYASENTRNSSEHLACQLVDF